MNKPVPIELYHQVENYIHGQPLAVDTPLLPEKATYADTVEAIKIMIDNKEDVKRGYFIQFNNSYTQIRKCEIANTAPGNDTNPKTT